MKIGNCVSFKSVETIEEQLKNLKKCGMDNCQIVSWSPKLWTDENAQLLKKVTKELEVTISGFWCGWEGPADWNFYSGQLTLGLVPPEYRQMRIKNLCDGSDFAKKLSVTDVITHMGYIPENPYDPNFAPLCIAIRTVARHCKKNGQYLLFETGQETPVAMLRCFEQVGEDNLGVNLDTANLILYGKANPVDALHILGKYVRNIHAKDGLYPVNGHDLGRHVTIGEGVVDFPAFFKKLKEIGYDSYVTIEREIKGGASDGEIIAAKEYLEKIIAEV